VSTPGKPDEEKTLQLRFDGNGAISIPGFTADAANVGFVGEGQ
jgi:hypothetical protein